MQMKRRLMAAVVVGLAAGPMLSSPVLAQKAGADTSSDGLPYIEREDPHAKWQLQGLRDAGERACKEAVDTAALLGEELYDLKLNLSRTLVQVSGEVTRGMAHSMDRFSRRLHEMAERMAQPPARGD